MSISRLQQEYEATYIQFGDQPEQMNQQASEGITKIVETYGAYEAEYAAIRKSAGLMDMPHRALIALTGQDRTRFLQNLLTQDINKIESGAFARSFFLNGKGRIIADLLIFQTEDKTYLELDGIDVKHTMSELDRYLFADDVQMNSLEAFRQFATLGPQGEKLLSLLADEDKPFEGVDVNHHAAIYIQGQCCSVYRYDLTGSPAYFLWVPSEIADTAYAQMANTLGGLNPQADMRERPIRGRGIGWLAYNTARIEAGHLLYHIDFGPDSLPQETDLLAETTCFTKGCYIGQEIVARMFNLGHPKRVVVGLDIESGELPISGSPVFQPFEDGSSEEGSEIIGGITSSAMAPLLSGHAICLATMKWGKHTEGTKVQVPAEGGRVNASIIPLKTMRDGYIVK